MVRHLSMGLSDRSLWEPIDAAGAELNALEAETRRPRRPLCQRLEPGIVIADASIRDGRYDKTLLLLIGQERARRSRS